MNKIVIDFDSLYTNIYKLGSGLVLSEPTVVAVGTDGRNDVKAVGIDARKLIGKTADNTKIVFPVFEGEIVNEKVAVKLLSAFFDKIGLKSKLVGNYAIVSIPCGASAQSIEKYRNVIKSAGINKIKFVEAPLLAAFSQKVPLTDSVPAFMIDMAGGTTNIAAVSSSGIIAGISVNFGGNKVTTDIIDYVAEVFGLQIGLLTAERLKKETGSLMQDDALAMVVNGRDIKTGAPRALSIKAKDIMPPIKAYYDKIAELAVSVLVKLPPEVSAELRHSGIFITGTGAKVYGLEKYYSEKFDMLVNIPDNPEYSVALGGGLVIADEEIVGRISVKID